MRKIYLIAVSVFCGLVSQAQLISYQSFADFSTLNAAGWDVVNVSDPVGTTSWQQGAGVVADGALSVPGYAGCAYTATSATGVGTISAWLITPVMNVSNGDQFRFYALSYNSANFPDRLSVRLSTSGASTALPANVSDLGGFTTNLFTINPDLTTTGFPSVVGASNGWTLFTITVSGIGTNVPCRLAFHYNVPDGGGAGANSSSIGIDEFYHVGPAGYVGISENSANLNMSFYPNPANEQVVLTYSGFARENSMLQIYDVTGKLVVSNNFVSQENGVVTVDTRNLQNGTYLAQVINGNSVRVERIVVAH